MDELEQQVTDLTIQVAGFRLALSDSLDAQHTLVNEVKRLMSDLKANQFSIQRYQKNEGRVEYATTADRRRKVQGVMA